jgi:hypothetical protein
MIRGPIIDFLWVVVLFLLIVWLLRALGWINT